MFLFPFSIYILALVTTIKTSTFVILFDGDTRERNWVHMSSPLHLLYMWIFRILKINGCMYNVWGIVVYCNVGSLVRSCKACHFPKLSWLNVGKYIQKKKEEIWRNKRLALWLMAVVDLIVRGKPTKYRDKHIQGWFFFSFLTDFSYSPLKKKSESCRTWSEQVKNILFERYCRRFQLFSFISSYFISKSESSLYK